jgi:hypothetical protein
LRRLREANRPATFLKNVLLAAHCGCSSGFYPTPPRWKSSTFGIVFSTPAPPDRQRGARLYTTSGGAQSSTCTPGCPAAQDPVGNGVNAPAPGLARACAGRTSKRAPCSRRTSA